MEYEIVHNLLLEQYNLHKERERERECKSSFRYYLTSGEQA